MQDHAYAIRRQFINDHPASINDHAVRVKLPPDEQREFWVAHLVAIRHPRLEPNPRLDPRLRRSPFKVLSEIEAVVWKDLPQYERDLAIREALENHAKDRAAREAWKEI